MHLRITTRCPLLLGLLLALFVACQTRPAPDLAFGGESQLLVARDFPAPAPMLRGFDQQLAAPEWRVGDEVLYGLRLRRAGDVRNWLLKMRVVEPWAVGSDGELVDPLDWSLRIDGEMQQFGSRQCRVEVIVLAADGTELGRTVPLLPRDFLARGIADACRLVHHHRSAGVHVRSLAEATVSAVALLQVLQEDDVLSPLLWQVIEKPSLWSLVSNLGARVVLRPRFREVTRVMSPVPSVTLPTWRLPIALFVNDAPALNLDLLVADAAPPFALGCGVLGATARHPSKPDVEFSLMLLSARRGP